MGVDGGTSVAREVLAHGNHPGVSQSAGHPCGSVSRPAGIAAVGPVADHGVVRIGPHVHHRGKIHVEAEGGALRSQCLPQLLEHGGIIALPKGVGTGQVGHLRGHPVHPSPLLIHAEEQGGVVPVEILQAVGELRQLPGALHVAAEEDHAAHLVVLDGLYRVLPQLGALDARHQQLGDLLLGAHGRHGLRDGVGGGGGLRRGRGGRGGRRRGLRRRGIGGLGRPGGAAGGQNKYNQQ